MKYLCIMALSLFLGGCENTQYAGLNKAIVIAPNGETWEVISGKDQTDTHLRIIRGDITVEYSSAKEDATAALTQALKAQTDLVGKLSDLIVGSVKP